MKVNELKFDEVVIDDEIEVVFEGQTVACPPAMSSEQGRHGKQITTSVCISARIPVVKVI